MDVLLGLDHAHLMAVLATRIGKDDDPVASHPKLGCIARGVIETEPRRVAARTNVSFSTEDQDPLAHAIRRFCDTEDFGRTWRPCSAEYG